jgi:hypothetical protein
MAGGQPIGTFDLGLTADWDDWEEHSCDVPVEVTGERTSIEMRFSGGVTTYHYWFVTVT